MYGQVEKHLNYLIAVDLDGTLFAPSGNVSKRTRMAIEDACSSGHQVVAVTGRSWRTAATRLKPVSGINRIICSNGAYEYRLDERRITWSCPVPGADATAWCNKIREHFPQASFGWESAEGLGYEAEFLVAAGDPDSLEQGGDAGLMAASPAYKIFIRTPKLARVELQQAVSDILGGRAEVTPSSAPFVEASLPGVNKATGLSRVANDLGFSSAHTMAFGDNLNDLPMLEWAGVSIAMGNAVEEVKSVSNRLTLSNSECGVAVFIEEFLAKGKL